MHRGTDDGRERTRERARRDAASADDGSPSADPDPAFRYRHGLAELLHVREAPAWMRYDARAGAHVAPGHRMPELRAWAAERGIPEATSSPDTLDAPLFDPRHPRDYQREALERWDAAGGRGTVVLPTGAGKSFVAVLAIHRHGRGACVVAPTRALVGQWYGQLADAFGPDRVGAFYGDEKDPAPVTVTTYHSAFRLLEREGRRFDLLVLDEAHHLADAAGGGPKAWHDALRIAPAARRLGLTATYPDGADDELRALVGPVVYRRRVGEMTDVELAAFALERRYVALTDDERRRYDEATRIYETFVEERGYRERFGGGGDGDAWRVFMAETRRSPAARRAFRAFRERERIVALCDAKLRHVGRLLRLFPAERAILFCGTTEAAERVSRRFAIPLIRAETPASERDAVLKAVDRGEVRAVASVKVLDEGWDVPAAKLGIVLGDSTRGGRRQHAQRLGRLLRRQGDAVASLFELVAADTHEFFAAQKRGAGLRRAADPQLGLGL
ncbi:MAG: DEAD/DEAH box helicase [Gemmatimonadota bacterium]